MVGSHMAADGHTVCSVWPRQVEGRGRRVKNRWFPSLLLVGQEPRRSGASAERRNLPPPVQMAAI